MDGWFFPRSPLTMLAAGEQAHVPLMIGWNSEEMNYRALLGEQAPTPENYAAVVRALYGEQADEVLRLYPGETPEQVEQSATDLAGDRFLVYSTWKWADEHRKANCPVYRYYYAHPRPPMVAEMDNVVAGLAGGVIRDPDAPPKPSPYLRLRAPCTLPTSSMRWATWRPIGFMPGRQRMSRSRH